jgi:hypothetical protein
MSLASAPRFNQLLTCDVCGACRRRLSPHPHLEATVTIAPRLGARCRDGVTQDCLCWSNHRFVV